MNVFLSHASEQKALAEAVAFSLRNRGYTVFLDKDDLPAGKSYDERIEAAVKESDFLVFLVSPAAVSRGRYTLTELEFARQRWGRPHNRVLPVMAEPTEMSQVPQFLKAVTILEPKGNAAAEISAAVAAAEAGRHRDTLATLAGAGALSGLLSGLSGELLPARFNPTLQMGDVSVPYLPGVLLGVALCLALHHAARPALGRLAVTFAVVQISWHAAVNVAIRVANEFKVETTSLQAKLSGATSVLSIDFSPGMIIPGLAAGFVGALGTWLGAAGAVDDLRRPSAAMFVALVGAAAGLLLSLGNPHLLYTIWQTAVAGAIGQQMLRLRG